MAAGVQEKCERVEVTRKSSGAVCKTARKDVLQTARIYLRPVPAGFGVYRMDNLHRRAGRKIRK